jgi:hypothetical protein
VFPLGRADALADQDGGLLIGIEARPAMTFSAISNDVTGLPLARL